MPKSPYTPKESITVSYLATIERDGNARKKPHGYHMLSLQQVHDALKTRDIHMTLFSKFATRDSAGNRMERTIWDDAGALRTPQAGHSISSYDVYVERATQPARARILSYHPDPDSAPGHVVIDITVTASSTVLFKNPQSLAADTLDALVGAYMQFRGK
ncbi:TPA: hypothetical protein HA251_02265 [Candidatus Woesearchaeota archaeon]|nr:hypothetical protein [Candidatus Woesearchaeota archaeon]